MKSIVTKQDMSLLGKIFKFTTPENLPLSFTYNGTKYCGIPAALHPTVERQLTDANITTFTIRAMLEESLEAKVEVKEYRDYPVCEFTAFFTNRGDRDTGILENIRIAEGEIPGEKPVFIHGNGDTCREDGFEWSRDPVDTPEQHFRIAPEDGTSCRGAFPYMRLMFDGFGVNIAVGWTGGWLAEVQGTAEGAAVSFGQERCHFVIRPGETMRTPRVNLEVFSGDETRGINLWRRWYFDHILPKESGKPIPPKCCMHFIGENGFCEFTGATEAGQLGAIDAYLRRGIRPDIWWVDAGWYKGPENYWCDPILQYDEERFPRGLRPIADKCHENGMQFLLWFEPERPVGGTAYYKEICEHDPAWILVPERNDGTVAFLLDLGNPDCCDFVIEAVDAVIKESGLDIYRQDFNMSPKTNWAANEAEDRIGAKENLHVQGYLRFFDTLIERNPGLWIDSCAGGGRRNDLETMRRAVPLHPTDVGYGNHPVKQKQQRQMFEWIPYFRSHTMSWDDPETGEYTAFERRPDRFGFHNAMAPALTDMLRWDGTEEDYALSREMQPIWRRAAELMLDGDYYPLTECRKSREDYYAMYFYNPDEKRGFVQAVRNNACSEETFTAYMIALDPTVTYRLTNPETGEERVMDGVTLAEGFTMTVAKRAGQVWFFEEA